MKGRPGWRKIKFATQNFDHLQIIKIKQIDPNGSIFFEDWHIGDVIYNLFFNYGLIFGLITHQNSSQECLNSLKASLGIIKEAVIGLKWEITPWVHTLFEHTYEFESRPIRPFLTAYTIEGSHKFTKKIFNFSINATKRQNARSGLCDLIHRDIVKLGLIARGIFP